MILDREICELHDAIYRRALDVLQTYYQGGNSHTQIVTTPAGRDSLQRACEMFERVIAINPDNWSAMFGLGIAHNLLKEPEAAYLAFASAYRLRNCEPDVGRELMLVSMVLGKAEEALIISQHVVSMCPNDPGLWANHALALLMNSRVLEAVNAITCALRMDMDDPLSQAVYQVAKECEEARDPCP